MSRGTSDRIDIALHETGPRDVVAIGIPSFGMTHLFFTARLLNLRMPLNRIIRWFFVIGKEIGHARNEIAAKALAIGEDGSNERCSQLLFLDDDLLFHPDALLKLLSHNRPIVSGLYYTKTSVPTPLVLHDEYGGTARSWTPGDVIECAGHGMGLCLLTTDVLRDVRDRGAIGVDAFGYPAWFETIKDQALVKADGTPAHYNSTEDWQFLQKARALGYQPCVDTAPQAFAWHLDTQKMVAYPQRQWTEFTKRGTVTWETDAGPVVWEDAA